MHADRIFFTYRILSGANGISCLQETFPQNIDSPFPVPYNEGILTKRIFPGKELSP